VPEPLFPRAEWDPLRDRDGWSWLRGRRGDGYVGREGGAAAFPGTPPGKDRSEPQADPLKSMGPGIVRLGVKVGVARQGDSEGAADPDLARHGDFAVQHLRQPSGDCQSEPGSLGHPRVALVDAGERLEYVVDPVLRDAWTGVGHLDQEMGF